MKYYYFFTFLVITSCSFQDYSVTYYTCNNITITRMSRNAESRFYYGKVSKDSLLNAGDFINAEYAGFNNNMDIYLIFKKSREVELVHYGGEYLSVIGNPGKVLKFSNYDNEVFDSSLKVSFSSSNCAMRIFDSFEREQKWTKENPTNIIIEYR